MVISKENKYLFIQLPMTGSKAIARELVANYKGQYILYTHATYYDFLKIANKEEKKYFVFSCLRNPMDKTVSHYEKIKNDHNSQFSRASKNKFSTILAFYFARRYNYIKKNSANFNDFFLRFYKIPYDDFSALYHNKMDFIIRFENLNNDFSALLARLSIDQIRELPVFNKTKGKKAFIEYYDDSLKERAIWVFGPFMRKWGYLFPTNWHDIRIPIFSWIFYYVFRIPRLIYWLIFMPSNIVK